MQLELVPVLVEETLQGGGKRSTETHFIPRTTCRKFSLPRYFNELLKPIASTVLCAGAEERVAERGDSTVDGVLVEKDKVKEQVNHETLVDVGQD